MEMELSDREVKFLLAWAENDGKSSQDIGKAAGLSEDATEVIAQKFNGFGWGNLTFGDFSLTAHGRDAIEQVREALLKQADDKHLKGL